MFWKAIQHYAGDFFNRSDRTRDQGTSLDSGRTVGVAMVLFQKDFQA